MSLHFNQYLTLLQAISAAVHTVQQVMPNSANVAKLGTAVDLVQAMVPTIKMTTDELKPLVNLVVAAAKSTGGSLAPVSTNGSGESMISVAATPVPGVTGVGTMGMLQRVTIPQATTAFAEMR